MKKKKFILLSLFLSALFVFNISWAEEPAAKPTSEFEVYNLGEIVVSAEKPKVKEIAVVNEITAEDIKATNSKTLAEALSSAPGVRVTTGSKNEPNVSIHGFAQNQILVLIDGVPYYETKYGKLDLSQIPTDNIAKIEVTKGAASVLYGPNQLGGVINVITKKPSEKPFTGVSTDFGDHAQRYSLTHGMKVGIFNYWLNYSHAKSSGYRLSDDFEPEETNIGQGGGAYTAILQEKGRRVNSAFESNNFWAKIGIEPNKNSEYYLNIHYLNRDKGFSPPVGLDASGVRVFSRRGDQPAFTNFARLPNYIDWGVDFDAKQKVHDKLTLKAKLFYHNHTDDYVSYSDETYSEKWATSTYKDYILGGAFFADFQPVNWNILRLALHYKKDNHQQRDDKYLPFEESSSFTGSIGLENEFNLIKNLSVVAGISYDWFNIDKAETSNFSGGPGYTFLGISEIDATNADSFNPMLGLTYTFSDATKIFGSVAHKSRFPTLNELYSSRSGNPDLKPEKSWNYTVGVSRPISTFARAGFSLFYYDVKNLITNDDPHDLGTNYNVGKIALYGFEVNFEVYPLDGLTLRADYAYEQAKNRSDDWVTDKVLYIPRHKLFLDAEYVVPVVKTKIDLGMLYVAKTYAQLPTNDDPTQPTLKTGDYTIFDAKITQPIWKYFEGYVAVKNIFDKDYAPEYGFPAPGRSFWFGFSAKF